MRVLVEGNIGAGKTSLIDFITYILSDCDNVGVYREPIEKWQDLRGHNLLELMYQDPKTYSSIFQTYAILTQLETLKRAKNNEISVTERSLQSIKNVFIPALHANGAIDTITNHVFDKWFESIEDSNDVHPDIIIYVKTNPNLLLNRIKERGRPEESKIDLIYLKQIHELHELWINDLISFRLAKKFCCSDFSSGNNSSISKQTKIIYVDGDVPLKDMENEHMKCASKLVMALMLLPRTEKK